MEALILTLVTLTFVVLSVTPNACLERRAWAHRPPRRVLRTTSLCRLIIGECTEISPDAYGWADTPGLRSTEQVQGWRRVTDAVHKKGGFMYAQLWHTGAMSHPDFFEGALPMSASAVNPEQESVTPSGRKPTVAPRPMSKAEIRQTVAEFGVTAKNALAAGFDGVQIQANYLYLIDQFLNSATNLRTDEYGGSCIRTKGVPRLSRVVNGAVN
jgi:2,4-dienoyl-CoA reductase-like NADH-dependent reductase (Old Yellow Enzyme family)